MKKSIFILFLAIATTLSAQDIVKIQPLSLIANSLTFEWEHIEGKKALIITIGIPVNSEAKKNWFNAPSELHTYNIRAGLRKYTTEKKRAYFEPYFKCQTIDWGSKLKQGWTEGYIFTTNAGVSLGYQATWKHLAFDFYPLGIEVGRMNGRLETYSKTDSDAEFMEAYIKDLSNKLPNNSPVHISRNAGKVEAVLDLKTYFWLRSGVSVGWRF